MKTRICPDITVKPEYVLKAENLGWTNIELVDWSHPLAWSSNIIIQEPFFSHKSKNPVWMGKPPLSEDDRIATKKFSMAIVRTGPHSPTIVIPKDL